MMICIQTKMLTFMDGFYNMIERMYKPKKVNVEKLKQYLKKQENDVDTNEHAKRKSKI